MTMAGPPPDDQGSEERPKDGDRPPQAARRPDTQPPAGRVAREVDRKAARKIKARARTENNVWFGLGMLGIVGWSVAVPTLIGVALGIWLDKKLSDGISWTLSLLLVGVALGCLNAWYWVKRQSRHRDD